MDVLVILVAFALVDISEAESGAVGRPDEVASFDEGRGAEQAAGIELDGRVVFVHIGW